MRLRRSSFLVGTAKRAHGRLIRSNGCLHNQLVWFNSTSSRQPSSTSISTSNNTQTLFSSANTVLTTLSRSFSSSSSWAMKEPTCPSSSSEVASESIYHSQDLEPPPGLRESKFIETPLHDTYDQLNPRTDGNLKSVGLGDRGRGLWYNGGLLSESWKRRKSDGPNFPTQNGLVFVLKVEAPLDNSDDAAGGIGRTMPATLLLQNQSGEFQQLLEEEMMGHFPLLRGALCQPKQVGYFYAELVDSSKSAPETQKQALRVYTNMLPPSELRGW